VTELEQLVKEWRDAQDAIDNTTTQLMTRFERQHNRAPLDRMVAAHNALRKYADEKL
jgi:hypothetical protein